MHLLPGVTKQPNLELKTRPKQLLGSLPLVITLPTLSELIKAFQQTQKCKETQQFFIFLLFLKSLYQFGLDYNG
jgi:hypothetical protein